MKKTIEKGVYTGERALFMSKDVHILNCVFEDGESPLKESSDIDIDNSEFRWKYPLWYTKNVKCNNVTFLETARSGVWYVNNIEFNFSNIYAPKTFRRCDGVKLVFTKMPNAKESFWGCKNIVLENVDANGDYFGMNSENIEVNELHLDGNYCFDGAKHIRINNSVLNSKDSFWNCEDVVITNSTIIGEYLAWNTKGITFINCKLISHQGLCYIDNLKMINCELIDSDLCFEYCSNIDADISTVVDSIKNPISGIIRVKGVKEIIQDDENIDKTRVKIVVGYGE